MADLLGGDDERITALQNLHAQKVRALMTSIDSLRAKVDELSAQNKDHKRSKQIQTLQGAVREQELIVDVLKKVLGDATGQSREQVNETVMKLTIGGPKRFRPKTREELEQEVTTLQSKVTLLRSKLSKAESKAEAKAESAASGGGSARRSTAGSEAGSVSTRSKIPPAALMGNAPGPQVAALSDKVEQLTVELMAKKQELKDQMDETQRLHAEITRLRLAEDQLKRVNAKYAQAKETLRQFQEENAAASVDRSQASDRVRAALAERAALQEQMDKVQADAVAQQRTHKEQITRLEDEVADLQLQLRSTQSKVSSVSETHARSVGELEQLCAQQGTQIDDLKKALKAKTEQVQTGQTALGEAQALLEDSQREVERLKRWKRDQEQLQDAAADSQSQLGQMRSKYNALQTELDREAKRADEAEASAREKQTRIERLEQELVAAQRSATDSVNAQASKEIEDLNRDLTEAMDAIDKLDKQVSAAKLLARKEQERADKAEAKLKEGATATQRPAPRETASAADSALIAKLRGEVNRLQIERDDVLTSRGSVIRQIRQLQAQARMYQQEVSSKPWTTRQRLMDSVTQIAGLQARVGSLQTLLSEKLSTPTDGDVVPRAALQELQLNAQAEIQRLQLQANACIRDFEAEQRYAELCKSAAARVFGYAKHLENQMVDLNQDLPAFPEDFQSLVDDMKRTGYLTDVSTMLITSGLDGDDELAASTASHSSAASAPRSSAPSGAKGGKGGPAPRQSDASPSGGAPAAAKPSS